MCSRKGLKFIDDVLIGNTVLILVRGEECKAALSELLTDLKVEHTTPAMIVDGIGSYVIIE